MKKMEQVQKLRLVYLEIPFLIKVTFREAIFYLNAGLFLGLGFGKFSEVQSSMEGSLGVKFGNGSAINKFYIDNLVVGNCHREIWIGARYELGLPSF